MVCFRNQTQSVFISLDRDRDRVSLVLWLIFISGWRLGLQSVTGALASTFILGTFYRSATLYHPQRRAILHLKSQKRKIKDKNKSPEDKLPFFDFSCLKSRSLQIILLSSSVTSVGMLTPFLIMMEKQMEEVETEIGVAWVSGMKLSSKKWTKICQHIQ